MAEAEQPKQEIIVRDNTSLSDAQEVARDIVLAKQHGFVGGMRALWKIRWHAWLEERMNHHVLRRLSVRKALAEKQTETVLAEHALEDARRKRLLADLEAMAKQTITLMPEQQVPAQVAAPLTTHIAPDDIKTMTTRALIMLGPEGENEPQWQEYRSWLHDKLPPNVAKEVENQIVMLRKQARG